MRLNTERMSAKEGLDVIFVKCCNCKNSSSTLVGKGEDFEYHSVPDTFSAMRCDSCGLIYLNPRPCISEIKKIYPQTYHAYNFTGKKFGFIHTIRSQIDTRRLLNDCRHLPDNAKILDVGCGDGFHLSLLRKWGRKTWSLEGVDIDKRAVDAASRAGFKVHLGSIEDVDLPHESYDMIFLIMTIEHVKDPCQILYTIKKLLKKGGRLVIVTDNTDTIDFRLFKKRYWGGYHFPRHWNLFNRYSLKKLAEGSGFEVVRLKTIVSPVNWVYSIHNMLVDRGSPEWLVNRFTLKSAFSLTVFTVLDFIFQKFGKGAALKATLRKPL